MEILIGLAVYAILVTIAAGYLATKLKGTAATTTVASELATMRTWLLNEWTTFKADVSAKINNQTGTVAAAAAIAAANPPPAIDPVAAAITKIDQDAAAKKARVQTAQAQLATAQQNLADALGS